MVTVYASLRSRVKRSLHDIYLFVFVTKRDGEVYRGEGTLCDAYLSHYASKSVQPFWTGLITKWQIIGECPMPCILRVRLASIKTTTASYIQTKFQLFPYRCSCYPLLSDT